MQTKKSRQLSLFIHDLTSWGGQDRSVLEIAQYLSQDHDIEAHCFQYAPTKKTSIRFRPYRSLFSKPLLLKIFYYHLASWWSQIFRKKGSLRQSTGTASLFAEVIQVQFIHNSWREQDHFKGGSLLRGLYSSVLRSYNRWLEKQVYTKKKTYIAISQQIKKELQTHFSIPENCIHTIHHGVNTDHFASVLESPEAKKERQRVRKKIGLRDDQIALLHVGALNERKGLSSSLEALKELHAKGHKEFVFMAVGAGNPKPYLNWCKENELEDHVFFLPHSKDIRSYYWASDVFFFPTRYEPFGLVTLEAMSCGLPAFVSRLAGSAELITHRKNGFVLDEIRNPISLSQEVLAMKDERLRQQVANKAREQAENHHWSMVAEKYASVYEGLKTAK